MIRTKLDSFRLRCRQFNWLAIFMVVSVGAILALIHVVSPAVLVARGTMTWAELQARGWTAGVIMAVPAVCYLVGVWAIGRAMHRIGKGALLQAAVANALRQVGLALGIGGVFSVFVAPNLARMLGVGGGWLHFDVPGMALGMIGGALFLLGRVMDKAAAAQAELDELV